MNRLNEDSSVDLVVVGAGLAGLTAAALVAREGRSVVVLERASTLGGRAATHVRNGASLNLGPHALYREGRAAVLLHELGVKVSGAVPNPGRAWLVSENRLFRLPKGPGGLLASQLLSLSEKARLLRFFTGLHQVGARAIDQVPLNTWIEERVGAGPAADFLRSLFRVSTYVDEQDRLSAGAAVDQFRLALRGNVLYIDGGWQTLIDGLREVATSQGAEVRTSAGAVGVETFSTGMNVWLSDGSCLGARSVILAVEPSRVKSLVGEPLARPLERFLHEGRPVRAVCLDVVLDRLPRPGDRFALGLTNAMYFSVHSAAARLAPDGVAVLHVMKYLREASGYEEKELESFLDRLQPGWRSHVIERRFLPGMTVSHLLPDADRGGLKGRPGVDVLGQPGLLVAGDWVGSEGMLGDASAASAATAARCVLDRLRNEPEPVEASRGLSHVG